MTEATERLEAAGLRVEGGIASCALAGATATRSCRNAVIMEAVYDIWDDFIAHMDDEETAGQSGEMVSAFEVVHGTGTGTSSSRAARA